MSWADILDRAENQNPIPPKSMTQLTKHRSRGNSVNCVIDFRGSENSNVALAAVSNPAPKAREPAPEPDDWTPEDWRAYFAEREAIAEYDGGMSRRQAELIAWEACINRWLDFNLPEPGPGGTCAWCKTKAITEAEKLPICNSRSAGWPWVHFECWENLRADWVYRADLALFQMGITKPPE